MLYMIVMEGAYDHGTGGIFKDGTGPNDRRR